MSKKMHKYLTLFVAVVFLTACNATSESEPKEGAEQDQNMENPELTMDTITNEIDVPWGMDWLPDGDMLITARSGDLWIFSNGSLADEPIAGVPKFGLAVRVDCLTYKHTPTMKKMAGST